MLFGCDYKIQTKKPQTFEVSILDVDSQIMLFSVGSEAEPLRKQQLVDYYYKSATDKDTYLYEIYIDDTDLTYIGIYMDKRTIKKMDSLKKKYLGIGTHSNGYIIKELDYYYYGYYDVCTKPDNLIEREDYPLYYHEFDTPNIPLENGEYRLVYVYTIAKIKFSRIDCDETHNSNFYLYSRGSIIDDCYVVDASNILSKDIMLYLYGTNKVGQVYSMVYISDIFVPVRLYNDVQSIYEFYSYMERSHEYSSTEHYYEFIKDAIIREPDMNLPDYEYDKKSYIYDYEKVKELFVKEYYK